MTNNTCTTGLENKCHEVRFKNRFLYALVKTESFCKYLAYMDRYIHYCEKFEIYLTQLPM